MTQQIPGSTVRTWLCPCGHMMFFSDSQASEWRGSGTVVCGRCGGPLSACAPLECDRPGQDFYRKHYDCPPDFTEIYWRAMQDRWQRYYARLRKVGLVDAGGGWMVER